ncbi:four helix bundle protein [Candidatus Wolfebacteria bacterium]|nr:four helix bundle protein [Candidatus Wolfebacteria bacterium]
MLEYLKVFQKSFDFLLWLKPTVQRFAKVHKYSLGIQLENESLQFLRQIARANLKKGDKSELINECFVSFETIKILIRLSREYKLLTVKQYQHAIGMLLEIGKLLGGWSKKFTI